jgi:hypothetical protein
MPLCVLLFSAGLSVKMDLTGALTHAWQAPKTFTDILQVFSFVKNIKYARSG